MENQTAPAANENPNGPMLAIQSVYLKDCSYEAPKGPRIDGNWSPQISLDINTTANVIAPELNEVVLTVTVGAKQGEATAFLVEVKQAGLFVMRGLTADDQRRAIGTVCPNVLFPYARVAVSQLVTQGGFPNFVLPPVDFDQLFAQRPGSSRRPRLAAGPGELTLTRRRGEHACASTAQPLAGNDIAHEPVAVLGAGSWGTALAIQFARAGHPTRLWSRNAADAAQMRADAAQPPLSARRAVSRRHRGPHDLAAAVQGAVAIIIAVPSHALRALLMQLKPLLARDARLAWATKGFELDTGKLPHQVAYDVLGDRYPVAVLSGPTFAREVGMGLPTAMTIASPDADFATQLAKSLHASNFRAYTSTDIVGVEVGGAVKNVLAVGAGLVRRAGLRREHAHRADHARTVGSDAPRRRARRAAGNVHGTRRPRRPGAHQHRQPVAQPALRPRARRGQERRAGAAGNRPGGRGLQRGARRARGRAARERRHADRRTASTASCTKTSPRRTWSRTS